MSYKTLTKFQRIIGRKDFDFISESSNISLIINLIRQLSTGSISPSKQKFLTTYKDSLVSFYDSFQRNNIPDLRNGFSVCISIIERVLSLVQKQPSQLKFISRGILRKEGRKFLYGLNRIASGLRIAFDPQIIRKMVITREQLAMYILDEVEGLGKKYLFNLKGNYSPLQRINSLSREELLDVIRVLKDSTNIRKLKNGWTDYGKGSNISVRLLGVQRKFGKSKIYFLFTMREHIKSGGPYQRVIDTTSPGDWEFKEAA